MTRTPQEANQLASAWRPLVHPVEDWPLAVCDGTSIPSEDLIECDQVRRKFTGATLYGLNSQAHKWYYLHHQRSDEVLMLKMFDSSLDAKATCMYSGIEILPPKCVLLT